ncbi:hypothetical protein ACWC2K_23115 [Streptomyces chattanoogensis]
MTLPLTAAPVLYEVGIVLAPLSALLPWRTAMEPARITLAVAGAVPSAAVAPVVLTIHR